MGNSDTSPSFTCFPDLAGELRNMIWREALPREPAPALVPFRPGCWAPEGDEPDLALRFDHRKLEPIRFDLALLLVNREARNIALAWMSERGFDVPPRESGRSVCARPFDPASDALYIGPAHWDDFYREAIDRSFEPDMLGRAYGTESDVRYIAMPESFVEEKMAEIPTLAFHFEQTIDLFVLVGPPWDSTAQGDETPFCWGFSPLQGSTFSWNHSRKCFEPGPHIQGLENAPTSTEGHLSRLPLLIKRSEAATRQLEGREVRFCLNVKSAVAFQR